MKFASAEALLAWIVRNWHYVPGDPLAEIIGQYFSERGLMQCGHSRDAVVRSNEGTCYCWMCEREANYAA